MVYNKKILVTKYYLWHLAVLGAVWRKLKRHIPALMGFIIREEQFWL